jgi:hypothetical protein
MIEPRRFSAHDCSPFGSTSIANRALLWVGETEVPNKRIQALAPGVLSMRTGKAPRKSKKSLALSKRSKPGGGSKPLLGQHRTGPGRAVHATKPDNTKQAQIISMLHQSPGASIAAIAAAVGWQNHSVRGFFAAVVKKRFGFDLTYHKGENGDRLYRIEVLSGLIDQHVR